MRLIGLIGRIETLWMLVMENRSCVFRVCRCAEGTLVGLCDYEAMAMRTQVAVL